MEEIIKILKQKRCSSLKGATLFFSVFACMSIVSIGGTYLLSPTPHNLLEIIKGVILFIHSELLPIKTFGPSYVVGAFAMSVFLIVLFSPVISILLLIGRGYNKHLWTPSQKKIQKYLQKQISTLQAGNKSRTGRIGFLTQEIPNIQTKRDKEIEETGEEITKIQGDIETTTSEIQRLESLLK